jgi:hypothetical protein
MGARRPHRPDFVIVGAMKSATTSLYRWLDAQPEVFMAHPKDSTVLARTWPEAVEWYARGFGDAASGQLLGEASVGYTDPMRAPAVAERIARSIPDARLIYLLRQPVDRIRSHYRHEVQRRREDRSLLDAIREPGNPYVGHSRYFSCLQPYIARVPREQILVLRFEDLVDPAGPAWPRTLGVLSLPDRPVPDGAHNVSSEKGQWTHLMAFAKRNHLITLKQVSRLPKPARRLGRALLTRTGARNVRRLDESRTEIPEELMAPVWEDVAQLESWLGAPLWSRGAETSRRAAS